jgi:hypothetical protein
VAGNPSYLEDLRSDFRAEAIGNAIARHDTPRLFNRLMTSLSYQGIADRIAEDFIDSTATSSGRILSKLWPNRRRAPG